jgi:hypothetical protein
MSLHVELSLAELNMAAAAGLWRVMKSHERGLQEKKHCATRSSWEINFGGALGELAFARAFGLYWGGDEGTFKGPDIGNKQIRTSFKSNGELVVRPGDSETQMFVLVAGSGPGFEIVGWMMGSDAMRDVYWKAKWGWDPAWFVPQADLNPINRTDDLTFPKPQARVASAAKQAQTEAAGPPAGPEPMPPVQGDEPTPF